MYPESGNRTSYYTPCNCYYFRVSTSVIFESGLVQGSMYLNRSCYIKTEVLTFCVIRIGLTGGNWR